jgi:transposase InsO family protein
MKKELIRREALKRLNRINNRQTYKQVQKFLEEKYECKYCISTLKNWNRKLRLEDNWDLKDKSTAPKKRNHKFTNFEINEIVKIRKNISRDAKSCKAMLARKGIIMSESTIKRVIKANYLSSGSAMEGKQLKWIRWERKHPNSLWQLDGAQSEHYPGRWLIVIMDDHSRYCLGIYVVNQFSTTVVTHLLNELIRIHGKPREILADNGSPFRNKFERWCKKQGIKRIRPKIGKPQTTGKVERLIGTIKKEMIRRIDLEHTRYIYNTHRPHQSKGGLFPCELYFEIRTIPII